MARFLAALILVALCGASSLTAQQEVIDTQMRTLRIPRVTRPPKLSDFLNGVPREAEMVVTDFRQYQPHDGEPVSQPTTAYLSYDAQNLYVAFVCKDDPKLIRARLAKHDQILSDDRVAINLDTFRDRRRMYWLDFNPYGVQADGDITDGLGGDSSWDTLWHSEGRITADGYVAMAAIPFKSLRFSNSTEQTWGLILVRLITRNNEEATWPYVSTRKSGWVRQGGDLEGLTNISPGRNLQFIPYGLFNRSRYLDRPQAGLPGFRTENEGRAGLDSKVVLRDAFTFDVAVNPDFSQVESDEPQVTVNQRYEVFFPEKRPFFLENAGYFETPVTLFFSRRIADPQWGTRLTGKAGNWYIGALVANDRAPGENVHSSDPLYEKGSTVAVGRLQREFRRNGRNSSVAAMVTSQDFGPTYNRVFSLDTRLQLLENWVFTGQAMTSNTRERNGRKLAGPAYFASWTHSGRHFISGTYYSDYSPNFRAQLGFVQRVDIRQFMHSTGYLWRPKQGVVQHIGPRASALVNYDHKGRIVDWTVSPEFVVGMSRGTEFAAEREETYEFYEGRGFRQHQNELEFESEWQRWLTVNASYNFGTGVNYDPPDGMQPFLGKTATASAGFTLRPGPRLHLDETYIYSTMRTNGESRVAGVPPETPVFHNHIARSKVNYQFSREFSLRFILDYNSILPNHSLVRMEKEKRLGVDALFGYMLNPGTTLYMGYTDLYENYRLDPTLSPALRRTANPSLSTGRQVFVKLSYLLRF